MEISRSSWDLSASVLDLAHDAMTQVRDSGIRTLRVSVDNQPVAQLENFRTKVFRAAELPQSCRATLPNQPRSRSRSRHSRTISVCAFSTVPQATFLSPGRAHHCFGTPARYPRFVSEAQGELAAGEGQLSESLNVGVSPSGFDHAPRARTMLAQEQS